MVISTVIAIVCELIRYRNLKDVLATFKLFFEGMGKILAGVVSLIVCGEFFAQGLIKSGAMGTLITSADQAGFGLAAMVIVGGLILWLMAFIMGSGNAAFFSFAPLVLRSRRRSVSPPCPLFSRFRCWCPSAAFPPRLRQP